MKRDLLGALKTHLKELLTNGYAYEKGKEENL